MTSDARAGTLIGSASRKNDVDRARAIDGRRLEDLLGQAAHVVAEQVDRERQAVAVCASQTARNESR